jgi:hypothetical protein
MIDYKKYIQVLEAIKCTELPKQPHAIASYEELASRICELFDTKQVITGANIFGTPKLYDVKTFTD